MKCTYCPREGIEQVAHMTVVDPEGSVSLFCDRDCLIGWAFMTATDAAMERSKGSEPVTPGQLRKRAKVHQVCTRCGLHVRHHEVANDERDLAELMGQGRSQAIVGDAPWLGLFCPEEFRAD